MVPTTEHDPAARLAAIVESSDDAIVGKTLDGTITSWNAAAERLFGYTAAEAIGQQIALIIPERLRHEESEILGRLRQGERISHYVTRRRTKAGREVEVSLVISPVRNSEGEVIAASKIARDMTEFRRSVAERERLLESERAARAEAERLSFLKDEFLATLSHELRTPLNAILGWCALLKEPAFAGDIRHAISIVERNARAQARIIDDLLDMSRIVSGKISLSLQPLSLDDAAMMAVESVRPSADARGVTVRLERSDIELSVSADPGRLQQVLWNLLTNAIKFTERGGRVDVRISRRDADAVLEVADTGAGIAAQFLPHVFDRFRQADASASRSHGGLGLGLSIVKTLVSLHGGRVSASSDGVGRGSTFSVSMPLLDSLSADPGEDRRLQQQRFDGHSVLVVDDDEDGRAVVARLLGQRGATVFEAANASEALQVLSSHKVQALLSDLGMPGLDGFQLIRRVRRLPANPNADVPAIAISAYARPEDIQRAKDAGFQQHVAKPVSLPALIDSLREVLRIPTGRNVMSDPRRERFADETQIDPHSPNRRNREEQTMADQKAEPEAHDLQSNSKLKKRTTVPGGDDTARTLEQERSDGGVVGGKPGAADQDGATV